MLKTNVSFITKIAVKGFKSIAEECEIDIRPLTILAGANSSGKSSIMQPLLMLKQTLDAPYDPGPLLLDGPNVQFTEAEQFLSTLVGEERTDRFQIRIDTSMSNLSNSVETTFRKGPDGIEIVDMISEIKLEPPFLPVRFTLYPDMSSEKVKLLADQNLIPEYFEMPPDSDILEELNLVFREHFVPKDSDVVKRSRCFLNFASQDGSMSTNLTGFLGFSILNSIHLPGLRGNPERTYKRTSTGPRYSGTFENYVANIIHKWQETKDKRLKMITDTLQKLGLTGHIGTQKIGDVGIELQVGRLLYDKTDNTEMVNIADVGFGVSQILPVLVAVIAAEPGRLVYIEQPELHLHPRAQVALAQVLADAAKRGVRVIAETHSSLLLLGIQTLVAEGDLPPELVKLHWFSRNKDGVTEVDSVDLDEAGTYGDWSMDFDDVSLSVQSRFLDAVDNVRFGEKEAS